MSGIIMRQVIFKETDNLKHYVIKTKNNLIGKKYYLYDNGNLQFSELDGNLLLSLDNLIMTAKKRLGTIRVKDKISNIFSKVKKTKKGYQILNNINELIVDIIIKDYLFEAHVLYGIRYLKLVNLLPHFVKQINDFKKRTYHSKDFVLYHSGTKVLDLVKLDKNTFSLVMNHKLEIIKIFPLVLLALKKID